MKLCFGYLNMYLTVSTCSESADTPYSQEGKLAAAVHSTSQVERWSKRGFNDTLLTCCFCLASNWESQSAINKFKSLKVIYLFFLNKCPLDRFHI